MKETEFDFRVKSSMSILIAPEDVFKLNDGKFEFKQGQLIYTLYDLVKSTIKLTELIDFKCDFDNSGFCSEQRANGMSNRMCCCVGCYDNIGYLGRGLPILVENLPIYREFFRKKIGFWRPETGCSLPRELRSPTCTLYKCWRGGQNDREVSILRNAREMCQEAIFEIKKLIKEGCTKDEKEEIHHSTSRELVKWWKSPSHVSKV